MFGLGPFELILILLIILVIFGAGKLPQVLGSLGKGVKEFREASETPADATTTPSKTGTTTTAGATTTQSIPPASPNTTPPPPEPKV